MDIRELIAFLVFRFDQTHSPSGRSRDDYLGVAGQIIDLIMAIPLDHGNGHQEGMDHG